MICNEILSTSSLEELLFQAKDEEFPPNMGKKHYERYKELKEKFANYPVEMGAMSSSFEMWIKKTQERAAEIGKIENERERSAQLADLFVEDPIVFLNRHDVTHTNKVQEKAKEVLKCFNNLDLTYYELYFLLCAAVVHDIGNIFGRKGHERNIKAILDSECADILPDSIERRVIARIARAHGGSISGNYDTISNLRESETINNQNVRERLLAAILRFADELADDSTRANHEALKSDIITEASKIYHVYSTALHTVELRKNDINQSYEVVLAYEFDSNIAATLYGKVGQQKYLIDEIYERTLKMERERRYCIRYLRPYCPLERIKVQITITNASDEFLSYPITYTLEESGYPSTPFATIKDVDCNIKTGTELLNELQKEGMLNEYHKSISD